MKKLKKRTRFNDFFSIVAACSCLGACVCGMTATVYTQATYKMPSYTAIRP